MLDIDGVCKTFNAGTVNEKTALRDLSLHIGEGEFVTVIGGNGAGKSTLLNAVAGVWAVDRGTIAIGGTDVTRLPEHRRARYIGRVFQDPMMGTAATMQIEENMALAMRRGRRRTLRPGIGRAERETYREMLRILDLGLENRLTAKVGLLSGGQRQALTLLMATLRRPKPADHALRRPGRGRRLRRGEAPPDGAPAAGAVRQGQRQRRGRRHPAALLKAP